MIFLLSAFSAPATDRPVFRTLHESLGTAGTPLSIDCAIDIEDGLSLLEEAFPCWERSQRHGAINHASSSPYHPALPDLTDIYGARAASSDFWEPGKLAHLTRPVLFGPSGEASHPMANERTPA